MTNNGANKISNFGNVIYDSGSDASNGRKRIGISATEIELLDDIPPTVGTGVTTSRDDLPDQARVFDTQKQSNNYHTLSGNRLQPKANVVYQDGNEPHLNSAVDKLLEKYAPDATPHSLLNTTTSRQPLTQANFTTARDEPSLSTFQTNAPPSSTLSHNYSSIIRPQTSQNQTQINNNNRQQSTRPASTYDSFQHTLPQSQQQQQSKASIPIKTKNGIVNQVVPGKLYTLDDDPLHLLFDRQNIVPPNSQQQQPSFISTFQPSNSAQINQDPLSVLYTDESQRYPPKPLPMTTDSRSNGVQPFDLGNLIERVQQDYAREIQPFVSSIKFVQKDREYGQSLSDVGFTTPVTVRKGFTRQADDILRQSFTRQAQQRKQANRYDHSDYSDDEDDDIDDLPSSNPRHPLQNLDSKQSFTSVTSASTRSSDYDDQNSSLINRKSKVSVQDQATSPPPKLNQTRTQPQVQKPPVTSVAVPLKSVTTNETDEETTTENRPVVTKFAQRISSDQPTMSSSGSITSDDQEDYTATYNEHEPSSNPRPNPSESIKAMVTNAPIAQPIDARTRERINAGNQPQQRSEDIRPTPPTIHPSTNSRAQVRKSESEESGSEVSGSEVVSESEDEPKSTAPINQMPPTPTTTSRTNFQQNTTSTPAARSSNTPQTNTRGTTAQNPPPVRSSNTPQTNARGTTAENPPPVRSSNAPQTNARGTTAQNPPSTSRTTTDNNARQAGGTAANPNIHFVPPDQRATTNERGGPSTSTNQQGSAGSAAQTGSTRFFQSDGNTKEKRSIKDAPAAFGNKIKSLFSRK